MRCVPPRRSRLQRGTTPRFVSSAPVSCPCYRVLLWRFWVLIHKARSGGENWHFRSNFPQGGLYFSTLGEMADPPITDTTKLLRDWAGGDPEALKQLTPRVYQELRRMAAHFLQNERPGCTLQSVDLVHEVYLRLIDVNQVDWQHRAHFLAVSATLMR